MNIMNIMKKNVRHGDTKIHWIDKPQSYLEYTDKHVPIKHICKPTRNHPNQMQAHAARKYKHALRVCINNSQAPFRVIVDNENVNNQHTHCKSTNADICAHPVHIIVDENKHCKQHKCRDTNHFNNSRAVRKQKKAIRKQNQALQKQYAECMDVLTKQHHHLCKPHSNASQIGPFNITIHNNDKSQAIETNNNSSPFVSNISNVPNVCFNINTDSGISNRHSRIHGTACQTSSAHSSCNITDCDDVFSNKDDCDDVFSNKDDCDDVSCVTDCDDVSCVTDCDDVFSNKDDCDDVFSNKDDCDDVFSKLMNNLYNTVGESIKTILIEFAKGSDQIDELLEYECYSALSDKLYALKCEKNIEYERFRKILVDAVEGAKKNTNRIGEQDHAYQKLKQLYDDLLESKRRGPSLLSANMTMTTPAIIRPDIMEYIRRSHKLVNDNNEQIPLDMDILAQIREDLQLKNNLRKH